MTHNSREAKDIGRFVRAKREITEASAYSDVPQRRRHVSHLTQSDLAALINVSTVVVSHIEQGRYPNLNSSILNRISRALKLTPQQDIYLLGLFEPRASEQQSSQTAPDWVTASIRHIVHPIVVVDPAYGIVALNNKARALFSDLNPGFAPARNSAVTIFQQPGVRDFIEDWEAYAATVVSGMRMSYAMYPEYRAYIDEIARNLEASDSHFRTLWQSDDPLVVPTIEKQFNHPDVGTLSVLQILNDIVEAPGLTRIDFTPADDDTRRKFTRM